MVHRALNVNPTLGGWTVGVPLTKEPSLLGGKKYGLRPGYSTSSKPPVLQTRDVDLLQGLSERHPSLLAAGTVARDP